MNYTMLILCFSINVLITVGVPIGVLIYLIVRKRKYVKSYLIGAVVFFLSQICLRLPILNFLNYNVDSFRVMASFYPIVYSIVIGLSAGVFEECGRFLGIKIGMKDNRRYYDGIAFGLGHGMVEALLITGMTSVNNLIAVVALKSGSFNELLYGITETQAVEIYGGLNIGYILTASLERIFAVGIHVGLTIMVLYGINKAKYWYLALAIIIHGVIDAMLGILAGFGLNTMGIEIWVFICFAALVFYTVKMKKVMT